MRKKTEVGENSKDSLYVGFLFVKKAESQKAELTSRLKDPILEKLNEIDKMAFAIKQSGTYLISTQKNQFVSAIEKFKAKFAFFESRKALSPEFLSQIRIMINGHQQLADYYNDKFVSKEKLTTSICGPKARFLLMMSNKPRLLLMTSTIL